MVLSFLLALIYSHGYATSHLQEIATGPTFVDDLWLLIEQSGGFHFGAGGGGTGLTFVPNDPHETYNNIMDYFSSEVPTMRYISPGDPLNSYLFLKINNTFMQHGGTGNRMPAQGGFFNQNQLNTWQAWILAGAPFDLNSTRLPPGGGMMGPSGPPSASTPGPANDPPSPATTSTPGTTSSPSSQSGSELTFVNDIWPLVEQYGGYHFHGGGSSGLAFVQGDPNATYHNIVNVSAGELRSMYYITPGDPYNSYLFLKINNTYVEHGGTGAQMPAGGPYFSEDQLNTWEEWILEGAPLGHLNATPTTPMEAVPQIASTPPSSSTSSPPPVKAAAEDSCGSVISINGTMQCYEKCVSLNLDFLVCYNLTSTSLDMAVTTTCEGWIGFGFSPDHTMVGSTAVVGWSTGSDTKVGVYQLNAEDASQFTPVSNYFTGDPQIERNDTKLTLVFSRPLSVQGSNLSMSTSVVWAKGSQSSLVYHDTNRGVGFINFASGKAMVMPDIHRWILAHAILMAVGWGFFIPIGVLIARFGKNSLKSRWFPFHRAFQLVGLILTLVAFIIIFVKGHAWTSHLFVIHRDIGIAIFAMGWFQPLWALKRPTNDHPNRTRFLWARVHWAVGRVAVILGYVQIPIGMYLIHAPRPYIILYVCGVAVAIALYTLLQYYTDWSNTRFGKTIDNDREPFAKHRRESSTVTGDSPHDRVPHGGGKVSPEGHAMIHKGNAENLPPLELESNASGKEAWK